MVSTNVLAGKSAVVTGGSRGIGRAIVSRLAADGAAVVFAYHTDEAAAKQVVTDVEAAGGQALAVAADMADPAQVAHLFAEADAFFAKLGMPGLDILVNNAAIALIKPMTEVTEPEYDRVMAVNAKGTFVAMQQAVQRMSHGGNIVSVTSMTTVMTRPGESVYTASKAAVEQFTRVAADELAERGIRVNAVSSGPTDSGPGGMLRSSTTAEQRRQVAAMTPLGRVGEPEDIADVVAFLVSPDARWLTGQNIRATGGLVKGA
ncbi:MAG TPA: glucose 1-dehydrogenase [Streptosporangiaceae bacterium]|nr:glucose 1-dehydrogenase [Streptosporangiaceae bacterium]